LNIVCRLLLKAHIRRCGAWQTTEEKLDIQARRGRLLTQVTEHRQKGPAFLNIPNLGERHDSFVEDMDDDLWDDEDGAECTPEPEEIESLQLLLPSTLGHQECEHRGLHRAVDLEIQLRVGQCNDALQAIRLAVGKKAFVFRNDVRNARSKKYKTKAYRKVQSTSDLLSHYAQCYRRGRKALQDLNAPEDVLEKYQRLTADHLTAKETFLDSKVKGVKHKHLAWFWTVDIGGETVDDEMLKECESPLQHSVGELKNNLHASFKVYRVNWLRAQASYARAREELDLVRHEMCWTVQFFRHRATSWQRREDFPLREGHRAFAARQRNMWNHFAMRANEAFEKTKTLSKVDLTDMMGF
jgi:hypothetical protein